MGLGRSEATLASPAVKPPKAAHTPPRTVKERAPEQEEPPADAEGKETPLLADAEGKETPEKPEIPKKEPRVTRSPVLGEIRCRSRRANGHPRRRRRLGNTYGSPERQKRNLGDAKPRSGCEIRVQIKAGKASERGVLRYAAAEPSPQPNAELRPSSRPDAAQRQSCACSRPGPEMRKGPDLIRRSHPSPLYLGVASGASRCAFLLPKLRWRELGPYLGPPS